MALTEALIASMGFPANSLKTSDSAYFTAALEWLNEYTDFELDTEDPAGSVEALPASAKIFITKYVRLIGPGGGFSGSAVSSESIGGMSKSYGSASESRSAFWLMARELLGKHLLRGRIQLTGEYSRWA